MNLTIRAGVAIWAWSGISSAAICIGVNCTLLDGIAQSSGTSLTNILGEIQGNIIDPVVSSQGKMAAWEGGLLDFSPAGAQGGVKITLWGGVAWDNIPTRGAFFGVPYSSSYITGAIHIGSSIEFPVTNDDEMIANLTLWDGPSDLGLGQTDMTSEETNVRIGCGFRHFINRNKWTSFYVGTGLAIGRRTLSAKLSGTNVRIGTPFGRVSWQGEESYDEKLSYFSFPSMLGMSLQLRNITISVDGTINIISQFGTANIAKWGPVGPFFGSAGFYNIGVISSANIDSINIWPFIKLGIEWNAFSDFHVLGNWNPKMGSYPQHAGLGLGWLFLTR